MIKIKMFEADGLYIVRSMSSANSNFFSSKADKKQAFKLMNKFLSPMLEIVAYSFNRRGWAMVFKSRTEQEIMEAYEKQYKKSRKAKPGNKLTEVRYMVSAHFRYFNSNLVKSINGLNGRRGSMIKRRIDKFIFGSSDTFERGIKIVESGEIMEKQLLEKFEGDMKDYDACGMRGSDNEFKNSRRCNSGSYIVRVFSKKMAYSFKYVFDKLDVVRQWIESTILIHFPQNTPDKPPISS